MKGIKQIETITDYELKCKTQIRKKKDRLNFRLDHQEHLLSSWTGGCHHISADRLFVSEYFLGGKIGRSFLSRGHLQHHFDLNHLFFGACPEPYGSVEKVSHDVWSKRNDFRRDSPCFALSALSTKCGCPP